MPTVLPDNPASQLAFFRVRVAQWAQAGALIGLSPQQAAAVVEATRAAEAALEAARAAREAALAATATWNLASAKLRQVGGGAVASIKTYAQVTGDPGVYVRASVPRPEKPGPAGAGGRDQAEKNAAVPMIRTCTAAPLSGGRASVEWTCGVGAAKLGGAGAGMSYRVERSIDGGPLQLIGVVGSPGPGRRSSRFIDEAVPAGAAWVGYAITPMRAGAVGEVGPLAVVQLVGPSVQSDGGRAGPASAATRRAA